MKVCIFSDFHADNWRFQAQPVLTPHGMLNSRFVNQLDVLTEMFEDALACDCNAVIFCGDLFHVRGRVPVKIFNAMFDVFQKYGDLIEIHMIPGNHDYADREGHSHALQPFATIPGVYVYSKPERVVMLGDEAVFDFIPYQEDPNAFLEAVKAFPGTPTPSTYLVAHQGIQEGIVGSGLVLMNQHELDPKDLKEPLTHYAKCFFGHYHKHQYISENILYVGATQQHDWTDTNDAENRGWLVFDTDYQTMVRRRSTKAFLFYSGNPDTLNIEDASRAFVAVESEDAAQDTDALYVTVKAKKSEETEEAQHLVFSHFDLSGAIDEWIHKTAPPELNKETLKKLAMEYLMDS